MLLSSHDGQACFFPPKLTAACCVVLFWFCHHCEWTRNGARVTRSRPGWSRGFWRFWTGNGELCPHVTYNPQSRRVVATVVRSASTRYRQLKETCLRPNSSAKILQIEKLSEKSKKGWFYAKMEDRPRNDPDPLHNLGMPIDDVLEAKQRQMIELQKADEYLEKIEVEHPDRGIFRKSL